MFTMQSEESVIPDAADGNTEGPVWLARGRVPGLDGLRALSIALVLFAHGAQTAGSPLPSRVRALAG